MPVATGKEVFEKVMEAKSQSALIVGGRRMTPSMPAQMNAYQTSGTSPSLHGEISADVLLHRLQASPLKAFSIPIPTTEIPPTVTILSPKDDVCGSVDGMGKPFAVAEQSGNPKRWAEIKGALLLLDPLTAQHDPSATSSTVRRQHETG